MNATAMTPRWSLLGAVSAAVLMTLAGCSSTQKLSGPAPVEDRAAGGTGTSSTAGAGGGVASVDLTKGQGADVAGRNRVVYFDFDSYAIRSDAQPVVEANAKLLAADPKRRMMAEGHTDERGGSEYNLALGQKRANAVVQALLLLGARENQLEAVSYGKERPAVTGSGEEVWAKNRRVELKDR